MVGRSKNITRIKDMSNNDTKQKLTSEIIDSIVNENKHRVIGAAHKAVREAIESMRIAFNETVREYVFSSEYDEADKVLAETLEKYDLGNFDELDILMDFREMQHEVIDSAEI